jgi:transglutaminase-like putative cysteine protease
VSVTSPALRLEERTLLGCLLFGAASVAYALDQPVLLVLALAAAVAFPFARRKGLAASSRVEGSLLAVAALAAAPFGFAAGEPAPALAVFLVAAQVIKLLAPRVERDRGTSCVVGVVLSGVAANEEVEPLIALLLGGSVACTLAFAMARNLRLHGGEEEAAPRWVGRSLSRRTLGVGARLSVLVGVCSVVFFFSFPRVGAKLFSNTSVTSGDRLSGFTDLVALDAIGKIKNNDRIAFRVESDEPLGPDRYWRGRVLDAYDGKSWRASRLFLLTRRVLAHDGPMGFRDRRVFARDGAAEPRRMTFYLEPLGTRALFTTDLPSRVLFKAARPAKLMRDDLGSVLMGRAYASPVVYTLDTYPDDGSAKLLLSEGRKRNTATACLEIPRVLDAARLREYALRALRDRGVPITSPKERVAEALGAHLRLNFNYTLNVQSSADVEPIQDFLYVRRRGHCELFASAYVVLLRACGIPARLVTGFHGGQWSDWSGTATVRQRDAHAWVEALVVEKSGRWRILDPTPPDADSDGGGAAFGAMVLDVINWLEMRWFSWVIAFDSYDQRNFLVRAREWIKLQLLGMEDTPAATEKLYQGASLLGAAVGALVASLFLGAWVRSRRRRTDSPFAAPRDEGLAALFAALAGRGYSLRSGETPLELAWRAGTPLGLADPISAWVTGYYSRRFGPDSGGEAQKHNGLPELLAAIEPGREESSPL